MIVHYDGKIDDTIQCNKLYCLCHIHMLKKNAKMQLHQSLHAGSGIFFYFKKYFIYLPKQSSSLPQRKLKIATIK